MAKKLELKKPGDPNDLGILTAISLFSGVGALDLGAHWTKRIRTVCYIERDPYAAAVLQTKIRQEKLEEAPIWDDVTTFDGRPWRGRVDLVFGGFPCQPVSLAGKREGKADERWLWEDFARIIRETGARYVLAENVPGLLSANNGEAFGSVLRSLAEMGMFAEWGVHSAAQAGAPHKRDRVWIVAYSVSTGLRQQLRGFGG